MRKNSGKMDQHINQASVTGVVLKQAASSGPAMCSGQGSSAFRLLLCLVLGVATLVTFWPVLHSGFINHDDGEYVVDNPHVATGLTARNVVWAFTTGHSCNWHPLTWLSHMLDVQVFGLSPAGHHAVNLLLHIANAVVLLFLLLRLTSALWPSFAVAALFALHPLHVESVAWVAERKDVLSTLFFLLTLLAYAKYVEGQRSLSERLDEAARPTENTRSAARPQNRQPQRYYRMALVLFVLGLMSKPMLVTLPFVLLLLDYWPLGRVGHTAEKIHLRAMLPLLKEKVPFLVLAMASALMTLVAQTQGHAVRAFLPASLRLENAAVSYVTYLGKTAWPTHLSIFYPHPNTRYLLPQKDPWHPASEQWPVWGNSGCCPPACHRVTGAAEVAPTRALAFHRLALVSRHAGAGDRPGASRYAEHGRPIHLHSSHWSVYWPGLGVGRMAWRPDGETRPHRWVDGCAAGLRVDRA